MDVILRSEDCKIEDSILPDNCKLSYIKKMNSETKQSIQPVGMTIAPKRTINEAGTIVLTPANEGEPSHLIEETLVEEPQDETPSKKRKSLRGKKFRSEWIGFDMFKGWLRAHPNPERAMCTACNSVLNAGKSELEKHATSIKHQKKMLELTRQQQKFEYDDESPHSVILVDATPDGEERISSSFLQKNDQDEAYYASEGNFTDQSLSGEVPQAHQAPQSRKPPEPAYFSKAIVTKPAPPWKATAIVNGHVTRLELNDYKGRYLILFFYPQNFSAVCPTEILVLSDRVLEFRALQTEIVACSVDSHLSHLAWARTPRKEGGLGNPKIPLLSDPTHSIARDYGVLLPDQGHSLRAHFIIDRRGILRHMLVNDPGVGRSISELLRTTQALQQVDETETGCPADWKPGLPGV